MLYVTLCNRPHAGEGRRARHAPTMAARTSSQAAHPGWHTEVSMRIGRNVIAPTILSICTVGSLVVGPVLALTAATAPVSASVAVTAKPAMIGYHL